MAETLERMGCPPPEREYRFHPERRWRFDLAWPAVALAVEIDGGIWAKNEQAKAAHAKPLNILRDMAKHNAAAIIGWRVLRYTPDQLDAAAIEIHNLFRP